LQAFADKQTQQLPSAQNDIKNEANTDNLLDQARLCRLTDSSNYSEFLELVSKHTTIINNHFMELIEQVDDKSEGGSKGRQTSSQQNSRTQVCGNEHHEDMNDLTDLWQLPLTQAEMSTIFATKLTGLADETSHDLSAVADALSAQLFEFKTHSNKHNIGPRGHSTLEKLIPTLINDLFVFIFANDSVSSEVTKRLTNLSQLMLDILLPMLGRTAYLDLLLENPMVRKRLLNLSANSNWVAKQIKRFPLLLDELLHPAYLSAEIANSATWFDDYTDELRLQMLRVEDDDIEAQMDALRYFKLTQQLRIAAADVSETLTVNKVSDKLTLLAEVILHKTIDLAWDQVSNRYGCIEGYSKENKGLGVIAYGKLGGIELGYGSDLDIVFIHDVDLSKQTTGPKQVSCSEFFVKFVQRISHLFTAKTYLGELYEIDLRLRPSGNSGLLISHIDTFRDYQVNDAWTWEHQALVRTRMVFGHEELKQSFNSIREQVLCRQRNPQELKTEVADMRYKMREHLDASSDEKLDLKQASGGITDLEFINQYWVLLHSHDYKNLIQYSDNLRILESVNEAGFLDKQEVIELQNAYLSIRNEIHRQQLNEGDHTEKYTPSDKVTQAMDMIKAIYKRELGASKGGS
jgi:glutamate-ammonia-ligase adenylyltransferase